jgi:hypothetical protein
MHLVYHMMHHLYDDGCDKNINYVLSLPMNQRFTVCIYLFIGSYSCSPRIRHDNKTVVLLSKFVLEVLLSS